MAGAERGEHLGHLAYEVVVHLALVDDEDCAPLGRPGGSEVLDTEAREAVSVFEMIRVTLASASRLARHGCFALRPEPSSRDLIDERSCSLAHRLT